MPAVWIVVAVCLAVGCGRRDFDARHDASDDAIVDVAIDGRPAALAGCAVYLAMDEPSWNGTTGEVHDGCRGLHPGTSIDATTTIDPVRGRVGAFVGSSSCVMIPDAPDLRATSALTLSAWVRPTQLAPGPTGLGVVSKRTDFGVNSEYTLFVWTDATTMTTNEAWVDIDTENDRAVDPNFVLPDNAWHQITMVYDGTLAQATRVKFYVDGALTALAAESASSIPPATTEPDLAIGCIPLSGPAQGFIGNLDDVVVWTRALDASEVTSWYNVTTR